jgi:rhodanese-related sulfurtransferase
MNRSSSLALLLAIPLTACAAPRTPPTTASPAGAAAQPAHGAAHVDTVSGTQARALVHAGAKLLDVRTSEEFAERHLDGAVNVPVDALVAKPDVGPKDAPVVVYCHRGRRAARAVETLRASGYTNVVSLGAMDNWDR